MTDTDTLLPCPFCGTDELSHGWAAPGFRDGVSDGHVECMGCGALVIAATEQDAIAAWNRRTPPTPATDEREAVAQWCSGCHEVRSVDCYRAGCPKSDTERRAAEILAAEARGYAMAVEDAANEATHLWEYGVPAQEFPRRIRAIERNEHGAGK